ncbi:MAG: hypothetical protein GXO80_04270 [Chlorobi bacterium]|nr:hypothetical protein [Chlorobiota bacterium]
MNISSLKQIWKENFGSVTEQFNKISEVNGLINAFNANIDAVVKLSGKQIEKYISNFNLNEDFFKKTTKQIEKSEDILRGLYHCFKNGIAEEQIILSQGIFEEISKIFAVDKLQMGGQGGIVANVAAICGVNNVYVHCASLPEMQANLFLNLPNLLSVDEENNIKPANKIRRKKDIPLIHYILEFDKNDTINFFGKTITCPKSNRFIATYDPLNLKLHIDENFVNKIASPTIHFEYIILSGYQMLQEFLPDGTFGTKRIDVSMKNVRKLKENKKNTLIHFEIASTQDKVIRKYLIDKIATQVESVGFNERELIDILEVINETDLAEKCNSNTNSVNLFQGMLKIFEYTQTPRMQLHMFGLYVTLQKKNFTISPMQNRKGMQTAAVVAAGKAGTGTLEIKENLLWAKDKTVSEVGLKGLQILSEFITENYGKNNITETGIFEHPDFDLIAVPAIIIDKPVTLVGMGDTISSVSLIAAR